MRVPDLPHRNVGVKPYRGKVASRCRPRFRKCKLQPQSPYRGPPIEFYISENTRWETAGAALFARETPRPSRHERSQRAFCQSASSIASIAREDTNEGARGCDRHAQFRKREAAQPRRHWPASPIFGKRKRLWLRVFSAISEAPSARFRKPTLWDSSHRQTMDTRCRRRGTIYG